MSKLLDLLYREYTRSRLAEIDAADDFASIWTAAHSRRSEDIAHLIAEALQAKQSGQTKRADTPLRLNTGRP